MNSSFKIIINFQSATEFSFFENFFSYINLVKKQFNFLFLSLFCKKLKKKIIINRSPFVYNKFKNQYIFQFYKGKLIFKLNFIILNTNIYNYLYLFFKKKFLINNKIFTKISFKKVSNVF